MGSIFGESNTCETIVRFIAGGDPPGPGPVPPGPVPPGPTPDPPTPTPGGGGSSW